MTPLRALLPLLLAALLAAGEPPARPALHELRAGDWTLLVALPDPQHPWFQRQLRFDWTGLVVHARWRETVLIGTPAKEDGLPGLSLGTSDEFPTLSAGDEAAPQAKPGVGVLALDVAPAGSKRKPRRVLGQAAANRHAVAADHVAFEQVCDPTSAEGFGWRLEKRVELLPEGAGFRIVRRLVNTGTRPIAGPWYCHHWFRPGGGGRTGTTVVWPFAPQIELAKGPASATQDAGTLVLATWPGAFYATITGFRSPADNQAAVRLPDTTASFVFRGDWIPSKHALYVHGDICPEPFLDLDLAPGAERAWTTTYAMETAP